MITTSDYLAFMYKSIPALFEYLSLKISSFQDIIKVADSIDKIDLQDSLSLFSSVASMVPTPGKTDDENMLHLIESISLNWSKEIVFGKKQIV